MALKKKTAPVPNPSGATNGSTKTKKSLTKRTTSDNPFQQDPFLIDLSAIYERAKWKKEKREYWVTRFRKMLSETPSKAKAKKQSTTL